MAAVKNAKPKGSGGKATAKGSGKNGAATRGTKHKGCY